MAFVGKMQNLAKSFSFEIFIFCAVIENLHSDFGISCVQFC